MKKDKLLRTVFATLILFIMNGFAAAQTNPVAVDDSITIRKYYAEWFNLLANDYALEGDTIMLTGDPEAAIGQIMNINDSSIRYRNSVGAGLDTVFYKISVIGHPEFTDSARVFVEVLPNELPVVNDDFHEIMVGDTVEYNIYPYAWDPDGDIFRLNTVYSPIRGEAEKTSDSTFWIVITENFDGTDSLRIKLEEGVNPGGPTNYSHFKLDVSPNPEYPWAVNDTIEVMRGDTVVMHILENDTDQQNDPLTLYDADQTYSHSFVYFADNDSTVTLVPDATAHLRLTKAFVYQAVETNNELHLSNRAYGYVRIVENPNIPVAVNDTITAEAGYETVIYPMQNDYDINGDDIKILDVKTFENSGMVEFNDTSVLCSPYALTKKDFNIRYKICEAENEAHYTIGIITVKIAANNNPPIAVNDTITLISYDSLSFYPLINDISSYGGNIFIKDIQGPNVLTEAFSVDIDTADKSILRIHSFANFSGDLTWRYRYYHEDFPAMISNYGEVVIHIEPNPDSMLAMPDETTGNIYRSGRVNVLSNDLNPNNDSIVNILVSSPDQVYAYATDDSTLTVMPAALIPGEKSVYYYLKVADPNSESYISTFGCVKVNVPDLHLFDSLDINNVKADFTAWGTNFDDATPLDKTKLTFEVPKGSGKETIARSETWIGGMSDNKLYMAAENYYLGADTVFHAGPYSTAYPPEDLMKYHVWKISREQIDYHIEHYNDEGYEPIPEILSWPGNGNTELGQSSRLAPFFDLNEDNIYNPYDGDVPLIRGDQAVFFIYNDRNNYHTVIDSDPVKVEIHASAYAYDQPDDESLYNTIFMHYDFYNRSVRTYTNTFIAFENLMQLGYGYDNFIGCDVSRGTAYVYNGTPEDGKGEPWAYGTNPPVQGIVLLGGPLMPGDGVDNNTGECDESINGLNFGDGIADNERFGMTRFMTIIEEGPSTQPYPFDAAEYYKYMQGKWRSNYHVIYGGNGYIGDPMATGPACRFMYPGASDPLNWGTNCSFPDGGYNQNGYFWTEETAHNRPSTRNAAMVTGPFTFAPGDVQSLDLAFVYARDNDTTDQHSAIDIMNQRIDTIRNRVMNGGIIYLPTYSVGIAEHEVEQTRIPVFPNPVDGNFINIDLRKAGNDKAMYFEISDITGRKIRSGSLNSGTVHQINISGIRPGIYVISFCQNKVWSAQKLIIR